MRAGKIIIGGVGGDTLIDEVIKDASHAHKLNVTHTFGILFNSTLESRGVKDPIDPYPGVWLHDPWKYAEDPTARFYEIDIPDMDALENKARDLLGNLYSGWACFSFFIRTSAVIRKVPWLRKWFNKHWVNFRFSDDCCQVYCILLREGGRNIFPSLKDNTISPKMMTGWLMIHGRDVTKEYRERYKRFKETGVTGYA